jgi:SAM-dependent methyltransferase
VPTGYEARGPLQARMALYRYQRDPLDLPGLAVAALAGVGGPGDLVLDVGTGTGVHAQRFRRERPELRVAGVDRSPAMAADVVADAARLPFPDGAACAALAMHMLYHVPDLPAAVTQLRRVVRPGGVVVVSTNGPDDKPEMPRLWSAVLRGLTGAEPAPLVHPNHRFGTDDGPLLKAAFDLVELRRYERTSVVPAPEPLLAYLDSLRAWQEPHLPAGVDWPTFLAAAGRRLGARIERDGAVTLTTRTGVFVCR